MIFFRSSHTHIFSNLGLTKIAGVANQIAEFNRCENVPPIFDENLGFMVFAYSLCN